MPHIKHTMFLLILANQILAAGLKAPITVGQLLKHFPFEEHFTSNVSHISDCSARA